ncbi:hypothetical protein [Actinacidiphila bryophytorum]|uniref:hypothetical protein n=1 Tax=Actinacidiphila bryophytorum TaxID=1436133 RepID=UPI002176D81B|nr:hypothetical protein [Actinacidiphila bryophytorum]UWE08572.1 hypothetical protein NYE86_07465 [Actinacidiphila bryophytorum]
MGFWDEPTVGVIVGGAIATTTQVGTQLWSNWRDGKQQSRAAKAERDALQVRTLADLQEQLEAVSVLVGGEAARPVRATMFNNPFTAPNQEVPDLTPFSRAVMLCSRLDDRELGASVRAWLKDLRFALTEEPLNSATLFALRDRRVELQDRLGAALLGFH